MFCSQTETLDPPYTFIIAKTKERQYFENYREKNFSVVVENIFLT